MHSCAEMSNNVKNPHSNSHHIRISRAGDCCLNKWHGNWQREPLLGLRRGYDGSLHGSQVSSRLSVGFKRVVRTRRVVPEAIPYIDCGTAEPPNTLHD